MAENEEIVLKQRLRYFPEGIFGKGFGSGVEKFVRKRQTRKEASNIIHEKNAILRDTSAFLKDVKGHEITKARRAIMDIRTELQIGLQDAIDVIDYNSILLKEDLEATLKFLKEQGTQLSTEGLETLIGEMEKLKEILVECYHYCNELEFVADGREAQILGKIRSAYMEYKKGLPFKIELFERLHERGEAKRTFKEEGKILEIENKNFLKFSVSQREGEEEALLKNYKKYVADYTKLMREMFVFTYILLHNGAIAKTEVDTAMSEKRYDLPTTYAVFTKSFEALFKEEKNALIGMRKSVNRLADNVDAAIELAKRSLKVEKKELVHA